MNRLSKQLGNLRSMFKDMAEGLDNDELREIFQPNGDKSLLEVNDDIIDTYDDTKDFETMVKQFRKGTLMPFIFEQAVKQGLRNEDDQLILQGKDRAGLGYGRGSVDIDVDIIQEWVLDRIWNAMMHNLPDTAKADINEDSFKAQLEDVLNDLFDLVNKSGYSKASIRDAIQEGLLPESVREKEEPDHETDASVFRTQSSSYDEDELYNIANKRLEDIHKRRQDLKEKLEDARENGHDEQVQVFEETLESIEEEEQEIRSTYELA
jgi:hypothetical protein